MKLDELRKSLQEPQAEPARSNAPAPDSEALAGSAGSAIAAQCVTADVHLQQVRDFAAKWMGPPPFGYAARSGKTDITHAILESARVRDNQRTRAAAAAGAGVSTFLCPKCGEYYENTNPHYVPSTCAACESYL